MAPLDDTLENAVSFAGADLHVVTTSGVSAFEESPLASRTAFAVFVGNKPAAAVHVRSKVVAPQESSDRHVDEVIWK